MFTTIKIAEFWKAVAAFIAPGAVIIGSAVLTTSDGGAALTSGEMITALVACVVTSATVYRTPNQPAASTATSTASEPTTEPMDEATIAASSE